MKVRLTFFLRVKVILRLTTGSKVWYNSGALRLRPKTWTFKPAALRFNLILHLTRSLLHWRWRASISTFYFVFPLAQERTLSDCMRMIMITVRVMRMIMIRTIIRRGPLARWPQILRRVKQKFC